VRDAIAAATNEIKNGIHMAILRVLVGIVIIAAAVGIVALSHGVDKTSLSAQDQERIVQECAGCHDESSLLDDGVHDIHDDISCLSCHDSIHPIHAQAECQACHAGTAGLETADEAHKVLTWVGIGGAGLLLSAFMLNFGAARLRIRKRSH